MDYADYFDDTAHRTEFEARYNANVQKRPDSIIVAGRTDGLDRQEVHRLLSRQAPKITHQTYDDIRNRLEFQRLALFGKHENLEGITIILIAGLDKPAIQTETYIFDIGSSADRNRISAYCTANGDLTFAVYDDNGTRHQAVVRRGEDTFDYGKALYIYMEAGSGDEGIIVVSVNSIYCAEARLRKLRLRLEPRLSLVLGSDITAKALSSMRVAETLIYNRTFAFRERLQMTDYIERQHGRLLGTTQDFDTWCEFHGHKFMHNQGHPLFPTDAYTGPPTGNLIQPDSKHAPIFRKLEK
jgi:hypothetical protein